MSPEPLGGPELEEVRQLYAQLRVAIGLVADPALRVQLAAFAQQILDVVHGPGGRMPQNAIRLSEREIDVLAQVAVGQRNDEIADRIGVSAESVKSYLRSAMAKLGARSRFAAARHARAAGCIP